MIIYVYYYCFADERGSICTDIELQVSTDEYKWKLGSCHASHQYSEPGTYTERCCIPNGEHIFSCNSIQGNGWANSIVRIGKHQFCDDIIGFNNLITINIPGEIVAIF